MDWTLKGNICYKYEATNVNYTTAKTLCKAAGGDIAMPKTQAELNNVIAFRNTRYVKSFHRVASYIAVHMQNTFLYFGWYSFCWSDDSF